MNGGWRAGLAVAAAALLVGCTSATGGSDAPTAQAPLLAGQPMAACTISGEVPVKASMPAYCGTLLVPEDRSNPSGRQIGLRVAVVPAVAADAKPDPLFAVAGGPGEASTSFFAWLPGLYTEVHSTHDIVLVDQRGTGASNRLILPAMPDTAGLSAAEADGRYSAWAKEGLASLDADPGMYTSSVAADDLDAVRAALGYETIDLYGTSYGGVLAQYYLRQHADHVRVAILTARRRSMSRSCELMAATSEHALDLLIARCVADPACHAGLPEPRRGGGRPGGGVRKGIEIHGPGDPGRWASPTSRRWALPSINALMTGATSVELPLAIHAAFEAPTGATRASWPPSEAPPVSARPRMKDEIFCSGGVGAIDPTEVERQGAGR